MLLLEGTSILHLHCNRWNCCWPSCTKLCCKRSTGWRTGLLALVAVVAQRALATATVSLPPQQASEKAHPAETHGVIERLRPDHTSTAHACGPLGQANLFCNAAPFRTDSVLIHTVKGLLITYTTNTGPLYQDNCGNATTSPLPPTCFHWSVTVPGPPTSYKSF